MKRFFGFLTVFVAALFLAGCVRTYTVVRDREDQDLASGNQGFLEGSAPSTAQAPRKTTRTIRVVEMEMRSPFEKQKEVKPLPAGSTAIPEIETEETQGYIQSEPVSLPEITPEGAQKEVVAPTTEAKADTYTVKKGDTLEKIAAKPEIYGNSKKWYRIYKANQDKLKSPNRIYPGQVLKIPRD